MILIDSSVWIEFLRVNGNAEAQARVADHLISGEARIAEPILLELWNGVKGREERKQIAKIEQSVPILPCTSEVFKLSYRVADLSRAAGLTVPSIDLIIFSIAAFHNVKIDTLDKHLRLLEKKIKLQVDMS
ncbi:PIN domain-containing protein [Leptonema illini]|uniref:PilT protein domain protein n=1 Tax=Leptonema illini DSM 21528 TaxID=929563 RepID=H2CJB4_9LEPT|nr:PIN domain-containing protein [Leptonema illini]EHQ06054.1 PilT protein domain protein [Leptonema illini DSM 21528]